MYTKKIYFSGGSFYELQEVFSRIKGVTEAKAGYINSDTPSPAHEEVMTGQAGAAMGVELSFDPKRIDLSSLMDILFTVIDPYSKDKQGDCEGAMYRSGVYYVSREDAPIVEYHLNFIRNRKKIPAVTGSEIIVNDPNSSIDGIRQCHVEAKQLQSFYPADETHQNYLRKHPKETTRIDFALLKKLNIIE